ncbi:hypothetical protein G9A89_002391 [Geosiphon pyriformis]|nr:hypothetical protein G9A89_002391 [Geosiphon pyriformis]
MLFSLGENILINSSPTEASINFGQLNYVINELEKKSVDNSIKGYRRSYGQFQSKEFNSLWSRSESNSVQRIPVTNPGTLEFFSKMAEKAQEASCLFKLVDSYSKEIYVRADKELYWPTTLSHSKIPGYIVYFNGINRFNYDFWNRQRKNRIMGYPGLEGKSVDSEFYRQFRLAKQKIFEKLNSLTENPQNSTFGFFFTGYRLGVWAILTAVEYIKEKNLTAIESKALFTITTFGQPRLGNGELARHIQTFITVNRITYFDDYVPSFPKSYNHHGIEYWIQETLDCVCNEYPVYECPNEWIPKLKSNQGYKDNPRCNAQFYNRPPKKEAYFGPYFGYIMGTCPIDIDIDLNEV